MRYEERHKLFSGKVIISYPGSWGGQLKDRWMWMGELNGEVWDYHTKQHLIKDAIAHGLDFVVLRVHKNGDATQLRVQRTAETGGNIHRHKVEFDLNDGGTGSTRRR